MKKLFHTFLGIACLAASPVFAETSPPQTLPGGYVYIWGDEFNGPRINSEKWKPELGVVRNQGSQQTYTGRNKNIRIEKGYLVLETHFEKFKNINFKKNGKGWIQQTRSMPYTSGSVTTIDTQQFLFGRLEVRAKLPKTKGIWPAIWLLGKNKWGWPSNGEIDIMENISQEPDTVYSTFHLAQKEGSGKHTSLGGKTSIPNLGEKFHVYVMEWDKDSIRLSVDNRLVKSIDLHQTNYEKNTGNPFRTPFYLILNSAVGGNWCEQAPEDGKGYPVQFLIDYVRFYQTEKQTADSKKFDPKTGLEKR